MSSKYLFSKKLLKKAFLVSTALKIVLTLTGLVYLQASGMHLPEPFRGLETHLVAVFHLEEKPEILMGAAQMSKGSASPHHVM